MSASEIWESVFVIGYGVAFALLVLIGNLDAIEDRRTIKKIRKRLAEKQAND